MANEFIARKGIVVLANGAKITGSLNLYGDLHAEGYAVTASAYSGSFIGDGSQLTGIATTLNVTGSNGSTSSINLKTQSLDFAGSNGVTATIAGQILTVGIPLGIPSSSQQIKNYLPTGTVSSSVQVKDYLPDGTVSSSAQVKDYLPGGTVSSSAQVKDYLPDGTVSSSIQVSYTGLSNIPDGIASSSQQIKDYLPSGTVSSSAQVKDYLPVGSVSASSQIIASDVTGIDQYAQLTGSNTFTNINTFNNTTNSTTYADGAVVIYGGLGVRQDVNISGSLEVLGLIKAASMSIQYVTSSEYIVGASKIQLNSDDLVRFAGIVVRDSGSIAGSGSLYWDSYENRWIYERESGGSYNSAVMIAGPKNYGSLGDEPGLVVGRVPVATGDDHIDNRIESSSIHIDFTTLKTTIEHGLSVSGSVYVENDVTASAFKGDGSQITGIVTNLSITGSNSGTGTIALKTEGLIVSGSNGISSAVSGQTVTLSGDDATTSSKGVASFNSTNFSVTNGAVSASNITINGTGVTLGGTRNITLAQITAQGATTSDQITLGGGAIVHGVLFTSASVTDIAAPVTNQVICTVPTGSYDSAHFDYVVKDGTNYRTGTVMAVWDTANNVESTDTSTNDIGVTLGESFNVDVNSGNARLKFTASDTGTWIVKVAIRAL